MTVKPLMQCIHGLCPRRFLIRSAAHAGGQHRRVRKILNAAKLNKHLGEQIMALDTVGLKEGFVLHSYEVDGEKLKTLLKNISLSNYQFVDSVDQLKYEMGKLKPKGADGSAVIPTDHAFDIKGVGMVWCLEWSRRERSGRTTSWQLRQAARRYLSSRYKTQDDPVDSSSSPSRVGFALKGATADDISRGDVICAPDAVRVSSGAISVKFAEPILQG